MTLSRLRARSPTSASPLRVEGTGRFQAGLGVEAGQHALGQGGAFQQHGRAAALAAKFVDAMDAFPHHSHGGDPAFVEASDNSQLGQQLEEPRPGGVKPKLGQGSC